MRAGRSGRATRLDRITGVCARPQRTPFVVVLRSEHSGCPFRCTRFGHRQCGERRRLVAQNTNTNTEPQVQTRLAGLLQLHVKVVADRRPTTHDGIKTASRRGPLAEAASAAGLQRARSGSTWRAFVASRAPAAQGGPVPFVEAPGQLQLALWLRAMLPSQDA